MNTIEEPDIDPEAWADRLSIVIVVDASTSMIGEGVKQLIIGVDRFVATIREQKRSDPIFEIALIRFGGQESVVQNFQPVRDFRLPQFDADGTVALGGAIELGMDMWETRKRYFREMGIAHYCPWFIIISGSAPEPSWKAAAARLLDAQTRRAMRVFAVLLPGAETIAEICNTRSLNVTLATLADSLEIIARDLLKITETRDPRLRSSHV